MASQRADDLDKRCLDYLAAKTSSRVLDLGTGAGGQSLRMVQAGAEVVAIDSHDFSRVFQKLRIDNGLTDTQLWFVQADISVVPAEWGMKGVTDVVMQRTIHYMRYAETVRLLSYLYQFVTDKLFISVTGMDSAVGEGYEGQTVAIQDRFFPLAPEQAQAFSISQPVCLYTQSEFITLLELSGWKVERCWQSAFGNIKAVCIH